MRVTTLRIAVRGVHCQGCTARIRDELGSLDGVVRLHEVGIDDGVVVLDLDEELTSRSQVITALKEAGFPSDGVDEAEECQADEDESSPDDDGEGGVSARVAFGALAALVLAVGLAGYLGYALYPRFDLPAGQGAALLALAVGAGVASFFSPCAFSLLLSLLGREVEGEGDSGGAAARPLRFATALSLGAALFVLGLGAAIAFGGRALVGDVVFTSPEGRILRVAVGLFLLAMGLVQTGRLPNPLHAVEEALRPFFRFQAEQRRRAPFTGHVLFGFGYLLAGFG